MTGLTFLANAFYMLIGVILICLCILVIAVTIYAIVQMKKDGFKKDVEKYKKNIKK